MTLPQKSVAALLIITLLAIALLYYSRASAQQNTGKPPPQIAYAPLVPLTAAWQKRIQASADDPKQARQVILDGIFANRTLQVGLTYEKLYDQKPESQTRLGDYLHAMMVAEVFCQQRGEELIKPYRRTVKTLIRNVAPELYATPSQQAEAMRHHTKSADAWLAWGIFLSQTPVHDPSATAACKQALKLDPSLTETYYWLANMAVDPYTEAYFKAHKEEALRQLNLVDRTESKLRPLTVDCRANIALSDMDYKAAVPYLQEYLRLWPNSPRAQIVAHIIQQVQAIKTHP